MCELTEAVNKKNEQKEVANFVIRAVVLAYPVEQLRLLLVKPATLPQTPTGKVNPATSDHHLNGAVYIPPCTPFPPTLIHCSCSATRDSLHPQYPGNPLTALPPLLLEFPVAVPEDAYGGTSKVSGA